MCSGANEIASVKEEVGGEKTKPIGQEFQKPALQRQYKYDRRSSFSRESQADKEHLFAVGYFYAFSSLLETGSPAGN